MINKKKRIFKLILGSLCLALPIGSFGLIGLTDTSSYAASTELTGSCSESISPTNSKFDEIGNQTYSKNDVNGWSRILQSGETTNFIIDITKNYNRYSSSYYYTSKLTTPPGKNGADDKILMINSSTKTDMTNGIGHEGYQSSEMKLEANSYYFFEVSMKVASYDSSAAFGSVYLYNNTEHEALLSFENVSPTAWTTYYFFVGTGDEELSSITLNLWLGSEDTKSGGVAFFDSVSAWRYSENEFYETLYTQHSNFDGTNYTDKATTKSIVMDKKAGISDNELAGGNLNLNFEKNTGWSEVEGSKSSVNAHAQILNNSKYVFESTTGLTYPGANYAYENESSMVLWAKDAPSTIAVESKPIDIRAHGIYKISMYVKTDLSEGSFFVKIQEQEDILTNFPELKQSGAFSYTPAVGTSLGISNGTGDKFKGGYQLVEYYVKGHNRYDTKATIQLWLGNESSKAVGCAIVDDIKVEYVSSANFPSSNSLTFSVSKETASEQSINNGNFNFTNNSEANLSLPLAPEGWTLSQDPSAQKENIAAGVINTYKDYFARYATEYGSTWGNIANPANQKDSPASDNYVNNVFMFWNKYDSYQSIESSTFPISSGDKYYEFSFDLKTLSTTTPLGIEIYDQDNILLFQDMNITSPANAWSKYKAHFYAKDSSFTVKAKIYFGTSTAPVSGCSFIDNVRVADSTKAAFEASNNQIDLSGFLLNLDPSKSINNQISSSSGFSGSMEVGNNGRGGVILGAGNTDWRYDGGTKYLDEDVELKNNVLVIRLANAGTFTLTSRVNLSLSDTGYYHLSFRLLTDIPDIENLPKTDEDGKEISYDFGVKIGLSNFEAIKNLQSNKGWTKYDIYFKSTSSATSNLFFSLVGQNINDQILGGNAFLTDLSWETVSEPVFTAQADEKEFGKTIFTSTSISNEGGDDPENPTTPTEPNLEWVWILIPSLIMTAALIVAIVGWALRKIKIKKIEVKRTEYYDRKITLNKEIVKVEAEKLQHAEQAMIKEGIDSLQDQLKEIEKEHKAIIKEAREKNGGKITKEIERQFKAYTSKKRKLNDKIEILSEQLATTKTPEYMLALERKIVADSEKNRSLKLKEVEDSDENKKEK